MRIRCVTGLAAWLTLAGCGDAPRAPEAAAPETTSQALATGPDFTVTSVTGPVSALPSQQISVSVRTCNNGTQPGSAPVELYLSSDNVITPNTPSGPSPDTYLTNFPVYLGPGECRTDTVQVYASAYPEGAYYLGAAVDPMNGLAETNENNNIKLGGRIGIGNRPDLVVSSVTAPIATLGGQPFTAAVTVCNQGTQPGAANLELYVSQDAVIVPAYPPSPTPDVLVGNLWLQTLTPGQCRTEQVQSMGGGYADGVWYVGAVVDTGNSLPELIEDNNTRAGNAMGVGYKPELVVTAVSGPVSAVPGSSITVTATVCNQGTQSAPAPLEWYLSQDAVITPGPTSGDLFLGADPGASLAPGQCATRTLQGYTSGAAGTYYVGAVVDPFNQAPEFFENNNTRAGNRIGIGNAPDFVVSSVSGTTAVQPGGAISASVRVCNQGTQYGNTSVELYLSQDNVITPAIPPGPNTDQPVGMSSVSLAASECRTVTVTGNAYGPEGTYYLGAVVDTPNSVIELLEDNNTRAGSRIGVGYKPDFTVTAVSGPASVTPGQSFNVTATVCNQGTRDDSTDVELLLSQDSVITPNVGPTPSPDFHLNMVHTSQLAPGACQTLTVPASAYVPTDGAYYLGAVADPGGYISEFIEDNNSRASSRIGVGYLPDFTVTAVSGPTSAQPSQPFSVSATVCNQGTHPANVYEVEFYLSEDTTVVANRYAAGPDFFVASASVASLSPGQCQTVTASAYASVPEGGWYLAAVVDPRGMTQEFIEDNNTRVGSRIGIGNRPDFVVTSITAPTSVQAGQSFSASVRVCNQGTQTGGTDVELYLSEDTVITPMSPPPTSPDYFLGGTYVGTLAAGQCQTVSLTGYASGVAPGSWYVGAAVDPHGPTNNELIEDNNTRTGSRITVL